MINGIKGFKKVEKHTNYNFPFSNDVINSLIITIIAIYEEWFFSESKLVIY